MTRERPIGFMAPMIRALRSGGKTQTRRLLKQPTFEAQGCHDAQMGGRTPWYDYWQAGDPRTDRIKLPYGPGDALWVQEAWRAGAALDGTRPSLMQAALTEIEYMADHTGEADYYRPEAGRTRWYRHMPRWASRLDLKVVSVRVERVQDISEEDAIAEGSREPSLRWFGGALAQACFSEAEVYRRLWRRMHDDRDPVAAWAANPWVEVVNLQVLMGARFA